MQSDEFDYIKLYANVFKDLRTMPGIFRIDLRGNTAPRRLFSSKPIAVGLGEQAKAEIEKMLEMNVIEPVEEPTD